MGRVVASYWYCGRDPPNPDIPRRDLPSFAIEQEWAQCHSSARHHDSVRTTGAWLEARATGERSKVNPCRLWPNETIFGFGRQVPKYGRAWKVKILTAASCDGAGRALESAAITDVHLAQSGCDAPGKRAVLHVINRAATPMTSFF